MSGTKGVVDIHIGQASEGFGKIGVIFLFFGKKAHIFKQNNIAIGHGIHLRFGIGANAAVRFCDGLAQQLA